VNALNDPRPTLPMVKCYAMCRETVADPGSALGWGIAALLGPGSAWFCPEHYAGRTGSRTFLSAVTDSETS
jgi:hypothetical protein